MKNLNYHNNNQKSYVSNRPKDFNSKKTVFNKYKPKESYIVFLEEESTLAQHSFYYNEIFISVLKVLDTI